MSLPLPSGAPSPSVIADLQQARSGDPFGVLGLHPAEGGWALRVMLPGASALQALSRSGELLCALVRAPDSDLWCGLIPEAGAAPAARPDYRLGIDWVTHTQVLEDAYRFDSQIGRAHV